MVREEEKEMRTLLIIAGLALLSLSLTVAGFFAGTHYGSQTQVFEESMLHQHIAEAAATHHLIVLLHDGRVSETTNTLNQKLDGLILSIGSLIPLCPNEETKGFAGNVLSDIARHRANAPVSRTNAFVDEKVKEILKIHPGSPTRE
jgi:hypothetical protein